MDGIYSSGGSNVNSSFVRRFDVVGVPISEFRAVFFPWPIHAADIRSGLGVCQMSHKQVALT